MVITGRVQITYWDLFTDKNPKIYKNQFNDTSMLGFYFGPKALWMFVKQGSLVLEARSKFHIYCNESSYRLAYNRSWEHYCA